MHNLAFQQSLLGACLSELLLEGHSLPSGLDLLPFQQRKAALQSLVTPACAHMVASQQMVGKLEVTSQLVSGALQVFCDRLVAAMIDEAGIVPDVAAQPGRCQLPLKK